MGSTKQKQPPKNIPILTKWKYNNNDGSISGIIFNSNNFPDGDSITTSSINNNNIDMDVGDVIVQTSSGTRYFLQGPSSATSGTNVFSFFGSSKSSTTASSSSSSISTQQQTALD